MCILFWADLEFESRWGIQFSLLNLQLVSLDKLRYLQEKSGPSLESPGDILLENTFGTMLWIGITPVLQMFWSRNTLPPRLHHPHLLASPNLLVLVRLVQPCLNLQPKFTSQYNFYASHTVYIDKQDFLTSRRGNPCHTLHIVELQPSAHTQCCISYSNCLNIFTRSAAFCFAFSTLWGGKVFLPLCSTPALVLQKLNVFSLQCFAIFL